MFSRDYLRKIESLRSCCAICVILFCISLAGCQLQMGGGSKSIWRKPTCNLPSEPTKEDVISRINQQVHKIDSWHSSRSTIKIKGGVLGIPLRLSADLAVEKPLNFRMIISTTLTSTEADLGSNSEHFWFWARRNEPKYVFTCSHQDTQIAREKLQIPFQPEWLMQVMGVVPLNSEEFILQKPENKNGILSLVSTYNAGNGSNFKRVILVDACYGRIIAHELRDSNDNIIAHADLNNYRKIKRSRIQLPHQIDLILYQPNGPRMEMQITLKNVAVNLNREELANRWEKPHYAGFPEFDIGQNFRNEYGTVHTTEITEREEIPVIREREVQLQTKDAPQRVNPAWIKNGKTEFILPGARATQDQGQTRQVSSEFFIPDNPSAKDDRQLMIPNKESLNFDDEEPDWSE